LVIVMLQSVSRQHVVDDLERLGYRQLVPEALRELPDPVDIDRLEAWCSQHGIALDELISRMGGSP
jgi:hypothetical protein